MARKKKENLYKTALVEKRNILNEIRNNSMSLQELRFFSIYLSKINARDTSTKVVTFPVGDFQRIMGLQSLNFNQLRENFVHLLQNVVTMPNNDEGFTTLTLFQCCELKRDKETGEWIVEIEATEKALPLMFEFKKNYFTYELWNALRLKSSNQIRMYEILKQYEKIGHRELAVQELKALLGIGPNEYPRWNNFKARILDSCQQALKEYTDICYTYEKGRSGRGGAWLSIIFHISKNTEYADPLALNDFINLQSAKEAVTDDEPQDYTVVVADEEQITFDEVEQDETDEEDTMIAKYGSEYMARLAESVDYTFTPVQVKRIASILSTKDDIPPDHNTRDILWANALYLKRAYSKFRVTEEEKLNKGEHIGKRFAYFETMLENYEE